MKTRQKVIIAVSEQILSIQKDGPLLVGIDGVDGSGKSQFASILAEELSKSERPILQSSVDFFHNKAAIRKSTGKKLSLSFFENSFNYEVLSQKLLDPLSQHSDTKCYLKHFDHRIDSEVSVDPIKFESDTILVFDGIFLHRDETRNYWDFSIFLDVDFEVTFKRMSKRDGCPEDFYNQKNARYYEGQLIYLEKCEPRSKADLVIDNNDYENPVITFTKPQN